MFFIEAGGGAPFPPRIQGIFDIKIFAWALELSGVFFRAPTTVASNRLSSPQKSKKGAVHFGRPFLCRENTNYGLRREYQRLWTEDLPPGLVAVNHRDIACLF